MRVAAAGRLCLFLLTAAFSVTTKSTALWELPGKQPRAGQEVELKCSGAQVTMLRGVLFTMLLQGNSLTSFNLMSKSFTRCYCAASCALTAAPACSHSIINNSIGEERKRRPFSLPFLHPFLSTISIVPSSGRTLMGKHDQAQGPSKVQTFFLHC